MVSLFAKAHVATQPASCASVTREGTQLQEHNCLAISGDKLEKSMVSGLKFMVTTYKPVQ